MRRFHLFEFHEQTWFPASLRDASTAFLRLMTEVTKAHVAFLPLIARTIRSTQSDHIVDLCSGAGGPIGSISDELAAEGLSVGVTLTDLHPNREAFEFIRQRTKVARDHIDCRLEPVNAMNVPRSLSGLRTIFNAFHHFAPEQARAILADACHSRTPIIALELSERSPMTIFSSPLIILFVLVAMPFLRPLQLSWLFWTYIVPVVPLFIAWDGLVSHLRSYTPEELEMMTRGLESESYSWEVRREALEGLPGHFTYVVGVPGPV